MTLVLTELSPFGIAMSADSAVTTRNTETGYIYVRPNEAQKLQAISQINAGISCWGLGTIEDKPTDVWLKNFIEDNESITKLKDFAIELKTQLNKKVPQNESGESRLGFHLAGFEILDDKPTPSFYHIHDGKSTTLQSRGIKIDPYQFNANHDITPRIFKEKINRVKYFIIRNGDYQLYAKIFLLLEAFFKKLKGISIVIPNPQNLKDRAEYLVFQIRTISEIYRLSNLVQGIGGCIYYLTINQNGFQEKCTKYF